MQNTVLRVESLSKSFTTVKAVNNISFTVNQGDIFAFLGPDGAGKTTTLRILLDIIKPDNGHIEWNIKGSSSYLPHLYLPFSLIGVLIWNALLAAIASIITDPNNSGKSPVMMLPIVFVMVSFLVPRDPDCSAHSPNATKVTALNASCRHTFRLIPNMPANSKKSGCGMNFRENLTWEMWIPE